ncbi:MAG: uracil-DNA glycosylase [Candidatus Promineifilaceae bacterium]|nr:uracil-DNA glycosylase [Candidatus Promineifilaceae bacterium]
MTDDKAAQMEEIAREVRNLKESPLYGYRVENGYDPVVGEGDVDANVMFIGEAPGKREAETGRPFVGASGRVLDELLEGIGLEREDVYITNVVKDRPPDNRDPRADEIELYTPFLLRQIEIIDPRVVATLGRFAMEFMLEEFDAPEYGRRISDLHGQPLEVDVPFGSVGKVTLLPLFHPAVALYNQNQRGTLEDDFRVLKRYL